MKLLHWWTGPHTESILEMDDLPEEEGVVEWGEGPPPGEKGWYLEVHRSIYQHRTQEAYNCWAMSEETARWLLDELDRRRERMHGHFDDGLQSQADVLLEVRPSLVGILESC